MMAFCHCIGTDRLAFHAAEHEVSLIEFNSQLQAFLEKGTAPDTERWSTGQT